MAIAEAEPKKSEVAVTSAGVSDGIKDKVLNAGKNFAKSKGYASSSTNTSVGTVKRYNLYDNIKGFRFEMPDGWNDEDIGLFVTCCWEKKDDFSKANIDKTKIWADIAQSGAKKSRNPSLFTINSCLELAERIRYYVSKNTSSFLDNEPFMKFHSDVKGLLPHFSDNFVTKKVTENKGNRKKVKSKSMSNLTSELLNSDSNLGDVIHNLTVENAVAIKDGNPNIWIEMSNKLSQHLGINTDAKTILESEKSSIISDINKMEEQGINKRDAFIERAGGFIEVFDYITPKKVKVSDYLPPSVDSTMDTLIDGNGKTVVKVRRLSYNHVLEDESVSKSTGSSEVEDQFKDEETTQAKKNKKGRGTKYKKTKSKVAESENKSEIDVYDNQEITLEPSSTTSFDEPSQIQQFNEHEKNVMEEEKKQFNVKTISCDNSTTNSPIKISPNKSFGRWKKERTVPVRIMPPRVARSKVTSYSLNTNSKARSSSESSSRHKSKLGVVGNTSKLSLQQTSQLSVSKENFCSKKSPNFQGFDTDSDDTTVDFSDGFKRLRGVKTTSLTKARVANPDTTTNDPEDKLVLRSDNDTPYLKRLNRKRKENVNGKHVSPSKQEDMGTKVRIVHADSTMKNLVVKLVDCHGSMDYPSPGRVITLPKQQEKATPFSSRMRPERSNQVRLIEETVVLAKDVVDSEYNPSSDSAKLVSDEHLSKGQLSSMMNEANRVKESMAVPKPVTSLKDTNQFSKGRDFSKVMSASNVVDSSLHVTKHHVSPFCESSKVNMNEGSTSASADSASDPPEDIFIGNRHLNFASICTKLKENSISPFSTSAGTSSGLLDANQNPETSTSKLTPPISNKIALETALATLKKCRKEYIPSNDNSICISSTNVLPSRFLAEIDEAKLPTWFGNFVNDFRKHEAWKIQQLLQMQQELADVEHRKVLILEKILGSLLNQ